MWWKRRVYLDAASGTTGNPSSPHEEGRAAKDALESARVAIARLLEVQADDVLFTSGATESNALAILGLAKAGDHALYLPSAHASVVENMKLLAERGVAVEPLPIKDYRVDIETLQKMLRPETVLVTMEAVCGETGVIWNTREVTQELQNVWDVRRPTSDVGRLTSKHGRALLHVDASQAPATEKLTRDHFGADLLTLDGAKVGVRGVGVLVAHRTIPLAPLYRGGGQERGLRPGSEAPELALAFAAALARVALMREQFRVRARRARELLVSRLATIPNLYINEAPSARQASNIMNLSLLGRDTDYLVALLDEAGFALSTRSACETDSTDGLPAGRQGSRAVYALTRDVERARSTLRISWDASVGEGDLARFAKALIRAVAFSAEGGSASGGIDRDALR